MSGLLSYGFVFYNASLQIVWFFLIFADEIGDR
jgi:hypothetical protein